MKTITRTPLCWPDAVARTAPHNRGNPQFKERSIAAATEFVRQEINRLNNHHWNFQDDSFIISSNLRLRQDGLPAGSQPEPADSGIAVYFTLRIYRGGKVIERPIVMSCDKWRKTCDNLYAIGKDIEAQRARERWGCTNYEQSFRGYMAIPEKCGGDPWWDVLGVPTNANAYQIREAFKEKSKKAHPDAGGTADAFTKLQTAYTQALNQLTT